jgi:hypothetical protein
MTFLTRTSALVAAAPCIACATDSDIRCTWPMI